jgi:hypothetical protein
MGFPGAGFGDCGWFLPDIGVIGRQGCGYAALIAVISGAMPMMLMTRLRL